jgi:DNA-binding LytR/AlgR family response regulator
VLRLETLFGLKGRGRLLAQFESLAQLQETLDPTNFFRIRRTEMVRFDAVDRVTSHKDTLLTVKGMPEPLQVSVHRVPDFRRWIAETRG